MTIVMAPVDDNEQYDVMYIYIYTHVIASFPNDNRYHKAVCSYPLYEFMI